jgi:broad specificity phosphatase PhoE
MLLYLIRHGETALNVARVLQPADTPLSSRGLAQAAALVRRLQPLGLAGLLSSDLPRTLQTAQALADATGLAVHTSPLLQERNFGDWRGLPYDSLGLDPLATAAAPPGGESQAEFEARCQAAWRELCAMQSRLNGPLAVVTHGLVLRCWLVHGPLQRPDGMALPERLGNTALTVAEAGVPHRLRQVNCTRHLDGESRDDDRSLSGG